MRAEDAWRTVPVVVATAMDLTDEDRLRLNGGVDRIVQKGGHSVEDLVAQIRDVVVQRGLAQPAAEGP